MKQFSPTISSLAPSPGPIGLHLGPFLPTIAFFRHNVLTQSFLLIPEPSVILPLHLGCLLLGHNLGRLLT